MVRRGVEERRASVSDHLREVLVLEPDPYDVVVCSHGRARGSAWRRGERQDREARDGGGAVAAFGAPGVAGADTRTRSACPASAAVRR